jgi:hypothetical protein
MISLTAVGYGVGRAISVGAEAKELWKFEEEGRIRVCRPVVLDLGKAVDSLRRWTPQFCTVDPIERMRTLHRRDMVGGARGTYRGLQVG